MKYVLTIITASVLLATSSYPVLAGNTVTPISWYGRVSFSSAAQVKKYIEVNGGPDPGFDNVECLSGCFQ